jgi:hypothetical protein
MKHSQPIHERGLHPGAARRWACLIEIAPLDIGAVILRYRRDLEA